MNASFNKTYVASLCAAAAVAALPFGANAQDAERRAMPEPGAAIEQVAPPHPGGGMPCPRPVHLVLNATSGASPYMPDFPAQYQSGGLYGGLPASQFNQTQSDKWFGHTFNFKPGSGGCCSYQPGRLTVVYRSLMAGINNDGSYVVHNGTAVSVTPTNQYIWSQTSPVAVGQTTTKVFTIPPGIVAGGRVSFIAQDDTAVVSAKLEISGCCLEPTRPE